MTERLRETINTDGSITLDIPSTSLPVQIRVRGSRWGSYLLERGAGGGLLLTKDQRKRRNIIRKKKMAES